MFQFVLMGAAAFAWRSFFSKSGSLPRKICVGTFGRQCFGALVIPCIGAYLRSLHKIAPPENELEYMVGSGFQTALMASVLVLIIARILRIGIRLREDAELTI